MIDCAFNLGMTHGLALMQAAAIQPPRSPVETEVMRIRGLLEKNEFSRALSAAQALLPTVPENRDVLYMIAVAQRYLGQLDGALATLERLQSTHPDFSRLFQERGHCWVALRNAPKAIEAFVRAVGLNPALPASWRALQLLFRTVGKMSEADTAGNHVRKLANLPAEVLAASGMFADGEIHEAERVIRQFLLTQGDHVEAMRLLARIGIKLDVLDDAELLLERVLAVAPDYHVARYEYAGVLLQRHRHARAKEETLKLIALEPADRNYQILHATACVALGEHQEALWIYRKLAAETPQSADLHLSIAHTLKTLGRTDDAIAGYRNAAAARPDFGDAYWSLANLKTYRFTDAEIESMLAQEALASTATVDRYHLNFALGKAFEDRGNYAESYRRYALGNSNKKTESRYRPEAIERNARLQVEVFTPQFLAARKGVGCPNDAPIFVVGLPRAGSTLLEQILASHSQVEGTMELADIPRLVHRLQGAEYLGIDPRYPGNLRDLDPVQFRHLGEQFIEDTRVYRTGKPFFIDKMPNNFRHIGLIHLILPNARIIDARREPMACCFSNFKQLFATGQEFTYSLEDIGRYYRSYVALMRHWDSVLPGKVLRIQHEDVVENLEANVRRILDFCGLPFEPACVEFHRTERSVRTASSEQVRRPIFREGLDQWRHFEPWLEPLQSVLNNQ